jgi:hypothetical protein
MNIMPLSTLVPPITFPETERALENSSLPKTFPERGHALEGTSYIHQFAWNTCIALSWVNYEHPSHPFNPNVILRIPRTPLPSPKENTPFRTTVPPITRAEEQYDFCQFMINDCYPSLLNLFFCPAFFKHKIYNKYNAFLTYFLIGCDNLSLILQEIEWYCDWFIERHETFRWMLILWHSELTPCDGKKYTNGRVFPKRLYSLYLAD